MERMGVPQWAMLTPALWTWLRRLVPELPASRRKLHRAEPHAWAGHFLSDIRTRSLDTLSPQGPFIYVLSIHASTRGQALVIQLTEVRTSNCNRPIYHITGQPLDSKVLFTATIDSFYASITATIISSPLVTWELALCPYIVASGCRYEKAGI